MNLILPYLLDSLAVSGMGSVFQLFLEHLTAVEILL